MTHLPRIQTVLNHEAQALQQLATSCATQADALDQCVMALLQCGETSGKRCICTGIGKAGIIARKVAATLASTGTPAFFMHAAEAVHGDLGMIRESDLVLAFSNSGKSEEVLRLISSIHHIGAALVALCGDSQSALAQHADIVISIGAVTEACPLGLAPSTSTTALLALGDAIALAIQEARQFTPEQYARFHPGGALGRKLMTCAEAMRTQDRLPLINVTTTVNDALKAISNARAGCAILVKDDNTLLGVFTDGDLRRSLSEAKDANAVLSGPVQTFATCPCSAVHADELLEAALHLCAAKHIEEIPVVNDANEVLGLIDLQDLADRGFNIPR